MSKKNQKEKNLEVYNALRECPQEALKTIGAGKLKGFSDINPMWRIKKLTEQFGICGIGWYIEITKQWTETAPDNQTIKAFCNVSLYLKEDNGEWSKPIQGTGGSQFTSLVGSNKYLDVSDECYKMAYTDAISVASKMLGVGADVYFEKDKTKYSAQTDQHSQTSNYDENYELNISLQEINAALSIEELTRIFNDHPSLKSNQRFLGQLTLKKNALNGASKK